ncbi:ABC transporter ATP-binding protein [Telmatobacter bradus]|uniref:ABC transporter ATP-binding protein n=1 Tax=Telmatobacter bradus TaxID=474953 RepID=UPI003B43958E
MPLLEVDHLSVHFRSPSGTVYAVNDISYSLSEGETLVVIGESGSGKSVHALAIAGLLPPSPATTTSGQIRFLGRNLTGLSGAELRRIRGSQIGYVFQDPMSSLNPVLTIGHQLEDVLRAHLQLSKNAARNRAAELLDLVHITAPLRVLRQYPHQLSGGMRQRVSIAIAIACKPKLLIADEPTTALDVTIQSQIVGLIRDLKRQLSMAVLWITHDMALTAGIADTVQVMYGGRLLERGPTRSIFADPRNAYTFGLLHSIPGAGQAKGTRLFQLSGQPPSAHTPPIGDPFAPRNPFATERCLREMPPLSPVSDGPPDHLVAAWYDLRTKLATSTVGDQPW